MAQSYDVSPPSCGNSSACRAHMIFSWSTAQAAGVRLNTVASFIRCALARGWSHNQYTLSLSATQFWSKSVRLHLSGGNSPPLSEAHTARAPEWPIGAHSEIRASASGCNGSHLAFARVGPRWMYGAGARCWLLLVHGPSFSLKILRSILAETCES